jgi:hypothetical protein
MARLRRDYRRAENRYEEAYDTAVCEAFADELDRWLIAAGHEPVDAFDEFAFSDEELMDGLSPSPDPSNPLAARIGSEPIRSSVSIRARLTPCSTRLRAPRSASRSGASPP